MTRYLVKAAYSISAPLPWYPKGAEAMAETKDDELFFDSHPQIFDRILSDADVNDGFGRDATKSELRLYRQRGGK